MDRDDSSAFINSYHQFKDSVDFSQKGFLPDLESLVWCMIMGVPEVPADSDTSPDSQLLAIDQRSAILKAVFIEVNNDQAEEFLDKGLCRYDQANRLAKKFLEEGGENALGGSFIAGPPHI